MPERILIVDDEESAREAVVGALEDDFDCHQAASAKEALDVLRQTAINLAILDVRMPDMNGLDLASRIREGYPATCIIILSVVTDLDQIIKAQKAGAYEYLKKPAEREEIRFAAFRAMESQRLQAARDELRIMLVHDICNLFMTISAQIQLILPDKELLSNPSEISDKLGDMQRRCDLVGELLQSFAEIERLESSKVSFASDLVSGPELLTQVQNLLAGYASTKGIEIRVEVHREGLTVKGDEKYLRRVLINLCYNAIKFTALTRGTRVSLSVTDAEDGLGIFGVADNGQGIEEKYHESIFEKFQQVRSSTSDRQGLGLGLNFCKLVVEGHGGRIWVESEIGKGAHFRFAIPSV